VYIGSSTLTYGLRSSGMIEQRSNDVLQTYLILKKEEEDRVAAAAAAASMIAKGPSSAAAKSMASILGEWAQVPDDVGSCKLDASEKV
jgi:hypothetical protein